MMPEPVVESCFILRLYETGLHMTFRVSNGQILNVDAK